LNTFILYLAQTKKKINRLPFLYTSVHSIPAFTYLHCYFQYIWSIINQLQENHPISLKTVYYRPNHVKIIVQKKEQIKYQCLFLRTTTAFYLLQSVYVHPLMWNAKFHYTRTR
jgi:REP element-mobilizing transposase RayT